MFTEPRSDCDEIKVTPEMIEAGVLELLKVSYNLGNEGEVVEAIFRAMLSNAKNQETCS